MAKSKELQEAARALCRKRLQAQLAEHFPHQTVIQLMELIDTLAELVDHNELTAEQVFIIIHQPDQVDKETAEAFNRGYVKKLLGEKHRRLEEVAELLGISPEALKKQMQRLGIKV